MGYLFDDFDWDWDDSGMVGDMFAEEEIKRLRIEREFEKGNNERHDENLDDFFEDDFDL
jgi:hypothetical protein